MDALDTRGVARQRVRDEMAKLDLSRAEFARRAGVDLATVIDFLSGQRWPRFTTLSKFDAVLQWDVGTIDRISQGIPVPARVSAKEEPQAGVMLDLPVDAYDDLTSSEREEAIAAAKMTFLQRAREIRRTREG